LQGCVSAEGPDTLGYKARRELGYKAHIHD
jgi:hypothetical protein